MRVIMKIYSAILLIVSIVLFIYGINLYFNNENGFIEILFSIPTFIFSLYGLLRNDNENGDKVI